MAGPDFRRAAASAVGALLALALGSALGDVRGRPVHLKVIALTAAGAFLLFGALTIKFVASELDRIVAARGGPAAASAVRLLVTVTGYVLLILAVLDVLAVPVQHLLLGGALTGVIVGIAAQQALGNAFAGLVLLIARPFTVGDQVRVRSGALGGEFTGRCHRHGVDVRVDGDRRRALARSQRRRARRRCRTPAGSRGRARTAGRGPASPAAGRPRWGSTGGDAGGRTPALRPSRCRQ